MKCDRTSVMSNPSVHNLTKDILRISEGKDVVDRYYDALLAVKVLKAEMEEAIK